MCAHGWTSVGTGSWGSDGKAYLVTHFLNFQHLRCSTRSLRGPPSREWQIRSEHETRSRPSLTSRGTRTSHHVSVDLSRTLRHRAAEAGQQRLLLREHRVELHHHGLELGDDDRLRRAMTRRDPAGSLKHPTDAGDAGASGPSSSPWIEAGQGWFIKATGRRTSWSALRRSASCAQDDSAMSSTLFYNPRV